MLYYKFKVKHALKLMVLVYFMPCLQKICIVGYNNETIFEGESPGAFFTLLSRAKRGEILGKKCEK